jgi:hypothetical protein
MWIAEHVHTAAAPGLSAEVLRCELRSVRRELGSVALERVAVPRLEWPRELGRTSTPSGAPFSI